jgi:mono/diheme cytochrome c family protein
MILQSGFQIRGIFLVMVSLAMVGCEAGGNDPGHVYFPDMMYSQAYETYTTNPNFGDGKTARKPVENSIPRGYTPYKYEDTREGYDSAGQHLTNPLKVTDHALNQGGKLYSIYCGVCHGPKGKGQGSIVKNGNYPAVPSYEQRLPKITEGNMFHSITYGRNLMGSYAEKLSYKQRWQVILYIQKLVKVGQFAEKTDTASAKAQASTDTTNQE